MTGETPAPANECLGDVIPFRQIFPLLADDQARYVEAPGGPDGEIERYRVTDFHCPRSDCRCGRVEIDLEKDGEEEPVASFRWNLDPAQGTADSAPEPLDPEPRPALVEALLALFAADPAFAPELRRRHRMVKDAVDGVREWLDDRPDPEGAGGDEEGDEEWDADDGGAPDLAPHADISRLLERRELVSPADPIEAERRPGRNDPCPCASGRKYKKCCGRKP